MPGSKSLNPPEVNSFSVSLINLNLRMKLRKITKGWEKARWGLGHRIVNEMICSLEGQDLKTFH